MKTPCLAVVALLAASCASTPFSDAITEGEVDLVLVAYERIGPVDPLTGIPSPRSYEQALPGVACTMSNDKGTWSALTTAEVQRIKIQRSRSELKVECRKQGFESIRATLPCLSPRQRHDLGVGGHPALLALLPLAIVTFSPAAPQLLAGTVSLVQEPSASAKDYDLCAYGPVTPTMVGSNQPLQPTPGWKIVR